MCPWLLTIGLDFLGERENELAFEEAETLSNHKE
jgi:hypothetical protein